MTPFAVTSPMDLFPVLFVVLSVLSAIAMAVAAREELDGLSTAHVKRIGLALCVVVLVVAPGVYADTYITDPCTTCQEHFGYWACLLIGCIF